MRILFFVIFLFVTSFTYGQGVIKASGVLAKINAGEKIHLKNATISGTIDITELDNVRLIRDKKDQREYLSEVKSELRFENCIFTDDFLAYLFDEPTKTSYRTNFAKDVVFINCTFKKQSAFKYSKFQGIVNLEGTSFAEEANFKYAEFRTESNLKNCRFSGEANFKYTKFAKQTSFNKAIFNEYANFKYAEFSDVASFKEVLYDKEADYKYAKFAGAVSFANARFKDSADFKYTSSARTLDLAGTVFEKEVDDKHSKLISRSSR